NSFGASVVYALPFLYPAWVLAVKRWQKLAVAGAFVLGVGCVLLTGSRSSFAGLGALLLGGVWLSPYRWKVLPALALAAPLVFFSLRPDLQNRYLSLIDPSKGVGAAEGSARGRTASFLDGMKSFAEDPFFGAGLGSYRAKTGFATHNVYNEAMGELGILGLLVLAGFAWAFGRDYLEARRLYAGGKGDWSNLCAAPEGPFRQIRPVPFSPADETFLYSVCTAAIGTSLLLFFLGYGQHNLMRYNWLWCGAFSGAAVYFLRQRVYEQVYRAEDKSMEPANALNYGT
ncbi:MAG: O-antigen ligase family protein, partial [Pirellulaceae bacterium]|nr:O-antigen ligase family protein [Pirellulaceae bacterium]